MVWLLLRREGETNELTFIHVFHIIDVSEHTVLGATNQPTKFISESPAVVILQCLASSFFSTTAL